MIGSKRRRLPVLVEQVIGSVQAESTAKAMAFEQFIRRDSRTTCRTGCDHCCYHPVEISVLEAIPIYRHLAQTGRWTPSLVKALEDHAEKTAFLPAHIWILTRIPCPFLKDSKCSVYDVRPFQCRTTWASGDPHYCHGQRFGENTSILARGEIMQDFTAYQRMLADQVQAKIISLPISRAVLWASKVALGEIGLSDILAAVMREYRDK